MNLSDSIEQIPRAGKVIATRLKNLGILTVEDLLSYWPWRYDDFSQTTPIGELLPMTRANIVGEVSMISNKRSFHRKLAITEALIMDDSGTARAVWFNQPFLVRNLKVGDRVSLSGKVEEEYGSPLMQSPVYEKIHTPAYSHPSQEGNINIIHTQGLVPNYNLTANLTQKQLRFLVSQVIGLAKTLPDHLPSAIKKDYGLIDLGQAIYQIHFPKNQTEIDEAKQRLAFDELFLLQLRSQTIRRELKHLNAPVIFFQEELTKKFVTDLPFTLTLDQKKSAWEIIQDLGKTAPITRLLEGDVGSGKTVVALLAMINVASNKFQSALLAPTDILARQHFITLSRLLAKTDFKVALLTRTKQSLSYQDKASKKEVLKAIAEGDVNMIIGTHALIQEAVMFQNLALVVVDEQHRFGVNQRQALITKTGGVDFAPHLLSMTATPIPRSLALALYDDLSLSIIKTMPTGRIPVVTKIFKEDERAEAYDLIRAEIAKGHQAFVVCPLIEESDILGSKSAKAEYDKLTNGIFGDLVVGLVHGKLKAKDKEQVMSDFVANKINILVATAVVEVGVDVPNATVMMIESADRFGLASLHQYRGRVGRDKEQSFCLLLTEEVGDPPSPKSYGEASKAKQRLEAMLEFNNGFDLAKADLKFRGPGEVYGTIQKGFPELKLASLFDFTLMNQARTASLKILDQSPDLSEFIALKDKLGEGDISIHLE
jgi:ATP-dependent DNA helicase RecG